MATEWDKWFELRLAVGRGIVLRDVQLWQRRGTSAPRPASHAGLTGRLLQAISLDRLPAWAGRSNSYRCFSGSTTTRAFFAAKLLRRRHRARGLVVELAPTRASKEYLVFHKELGEDSHFRLCCFTLDLSRKHALDAVLKPVLPAARIDTLVLRSNARRRAAENRQDTANTSDARQRFVARLSQCILGGLRLRAVPQARYEKLYRAVFQASEFTFRDELAAAADVPFEALQDCVETLLKLFTRS
ncbi:AaceriADR203Cp [[Ashbya] aceris (nom. inval.)]|nr:AaceriADR203Cp [[Ashbya] aceris (nom. inval.)]